jgi:hypothetical protein
MRPRLQGTLSLRQGSYGIVAVGCSHVTPTYWLSGQELMLPLDPLSDSAATVFLRRWPGLACFMVRVRAWVSLDPFSGLTIASCSPVYKERKYNIAFEESVEMLYLVLEAPSLVT